MKIIAVVLLLSLAACAAPKGLHPSGLEVGVWGSESNGSSNQDPIRDQRWPTPGESWDNDESTIGGHFTLHFEFDYEDEDEDAND